MGVTDPIRFIGGQVRQSKGLDLGMNQAQQKSDPTYIQRPEKL